MSLLNNATEQQLRAAAREWMDTSVWCSDGCADCHGGGCGITQGEYPDQFHLPAGLGPYVSALQAEDAANWQAYLDTIEEENRRRRDALNWMGAHGEEEEPPAEFAEEVRHQRRLQAQRCLYNKAVAWAKNHSVGDEIPEELVGTIIWNSYHRQWSAVRFHEIPY